MPAATGGSVVTPFRALSAHIGPSWSAGYVQRRLMICMRIIQQRPRICVVWCVDTPDHLFLFRPSDLKLTLSLSMLSV